MPAHERVIRTLLTWNVRVDEAFFMGGVPKTQILQAFQPHIYFDDQDTHCQPAAQHVPTAKVLATSLAEVNASATKVASARTRRGATRRGTGEASPSKSRRVVDLCRQTRAWAATLEA